MHKPVDQVAVAFIATVVFGTILGGMALRTGEVGRGTGEIDGVGFHGF